MNHHCQILMCLLVLGLPFFSACSDDSQSTPFDQGISDLNATIDISQTADSPRPDSGPLADAPICPERTSGPALAKVEQYIPAENEIAGWIEDKDRGAPGVEAGYSYDEIVAIIDGHQEPYDQAGCKGFARQHYKKGSFIFGLNLWEMNDIAAAKAVYDMNKEELPATGIAGEEIPCVYDAAVFGNDSLLWLGYVYKKQYFIEFSSRCEESSEVAALKTETVAFIRALVDKLP